MKVSFSEGIQACNSSWAMSTSCTCKRMPREWLPWMHMMAGQEWQRRDGISAHSWWCNITCIACVYGHPCQTPVEHCYFMSHFVCVGWNKEVWPHSTSRTQWVYCIPSVMLPTFCTQMCRNGCWACWGEILKRQRHIVVSCCALLNPLKERQLLPAGRRAFPIL